MTKKIVRRRYYRSKGRWSANINNVELQLALLPDSGRYFGVETLQQNPIQQNTLVSQQYTVKNIELSFEIESHSSTASLAIENCQCYIMYLPQGMSASEQLPFQHPEYILAYRYLGSPNLDTADPKRNPLFVKTRMARRLQTGDSLIFIVLFDLQGNYSDVVAVRGLCRYWTKAN